jgi:uncharacterized protein DUF2071
MIKGMIARRMLLNFRADADVVQRLLPAPLEVDQRRGHDIVGVCLIRLENLRPRGIPGPLGLSSENIAHRVAILYPVHDGMPPASSSGVVKLIREWSSCSAGEPATFPRRTSPCSISGARGRELSRDGTMRPLMKYQNFSEEVTAAPPVRCVAMNWKDCR